MGRLRPAQYVCPALETQSDAVYRIYIPWDDPLQSCDLIVREILMVGVENIGIKLEELVLSSFTRKL